MWFHEPFHSFVRLPQFSSFFSGTSLRVSSFGNFITFRLPSFQSTCPTRIAFSYHSIQLQSIRVATSFIAHILTMNVVCNLTVIIPWNQSIKLIKLNLIELIWFHFTPLPLVFTLTQFLSPFRKQRTEMRVKWDEWMTSLPSVRVNFVIPSLPLIEARRKWLKFIAPLRLAFPFNSLIHFV